MMSGMIATGVASSQYRIDKSGGLWQNGNAHIQEPNNLKGTFCTWESEIQRYAD